MPIFVIGQVTIQKIYTEFSVMADDSSEALAEFDDGHIVSVDKEEILDTLETEAPTIERWFDAH